MNPSFRRVETYIQSFYSELFSAVGKYCWNQGEPISKEKHVPVSGNHFLRFSAQKKQFFHIVEKYFSTNTLFRVVKTDFLASTNHFLYIFSETSSNESFFPSIGISFLNKSFILGIGEGFSLYWKPSTVLL